MNLQEIKSAVLSGKMVLWKNQNYTVQVDKLGQWFCVCKLNNCCWGLTWQDNVTLEGEEEDFYIEAS